MIKTASCLVLAALVFLAGCAPPKPARKAKRLAPSAEFAGTDFRIPNLANAGEPVTLSDYRGQVVLLDFWAPWSAPCRAEIPSLNRMCDELGDQGFTVIGMTIDRGSAAEVAAAIQPLQPAFPVGLAGPEVQTAYGEIRPLPTKVLLDRNGVEKKRYLGPVPAEQVRADIEALLAM